MKRLLLLLCWLLPLGAAELRSLLDFGADSPAAWTRGPNTLLPAASGEGIRFDLAFQAKDKRLVFDRPVTWNLAASSSLRFRVNVAQPDALLEATLFLKSGAGWYGAAFTLPHDGIHTLQLPLSDFKAEGSPAGWDRIEGLRLAFWPRDIGASRLVPLSLDAVKDSVWIVDGLARAKTADDRTIANAARAQVEKLLRDLGIPFARVPGDRIRDARGAKILILPHNPNLSAADVAELTSQVKAGSRLLVFQNENKELAALMGVRLGELQLSSTVGRFDRWAFPENRETGFPRRLYQHAWAFPDIRPAGGGTRVLAQWTNAQDQSSGAIAMLGHANGFWMSHPWRSADTAGKRQTLFAMLARLHPEIARHAVQQARDSGSVRAFQLRYGVLPARSRPAQVMRQVAEDRVARTLSWIQQGRWAEAWWEDQALFQLLEKAYASSRQAWRGDMVGIWDQQGTGFFAGGWDETCRALKAAGFTAVFPSMATSGRAHYASKLLPGTKTLERHGDQLTQFSAAAKKYGLERHIWKICWKAENADAAFLERMKREGRLMRDLNGKDLSWLSPSHPDNVQFEIDCLLEILARGPFEGLHLDYMRYPGKEADYGPAARAAFEAELGRKVANWPADVLGPLKSHYAVFRQNQIHQAVEKISRAVKAKHPRVVLSCAVWGSWPDCAASQGQDWPVWAKKGWFDLLMPMNYSENTRQIAGWLDIQLAQPGVRGRLVNGLGLISTGAELSPSQLIQQMELSREKGAKGVVLYRLDSSLPERLFPLLGPMLNP